MHLSRFPRVPLAHLPTPLEHLPRFSKHLGGPEIWVKRDDCTGLATGGNKTRKLEWAMGAALEGGADTIITVGALQSNHVRQTAAAAAKLGLGCVVLLEHRITEPTDTYRTSGNVLLDRMFGAELFEYPAGTDFDAAMAEHAERIRAAGGRPYIVPGGASDTVGALGYVNCALELLSQANDRGLVIDHLRHIETARQTEIGLDMKFPLQTLITYNETFLVPLKIYITDTAYIKKKDNRTLGLVLLPDSLNIYHALVREINKQV